MSWETDPKDRLVYLNNLVTAAGITPSPDELAIVAQLAKGMGRIGTIGPGIVSPVFVALLCSNPKVVGGQGLCFDGLTFDVPLDISGAAPAWPLVFKNCTFDKGIRMARAVLRSIRLENSTVHNGLDGDRLKVEGSFEALDCQIHGGLILLGADIGGVLNLSGCILNNPHEFALRATGCRVGGTVYCRLNKASGNRFIASGAVRFRYAEIGGNFHFAGASLSWGDMPAGEVASRLPGDTGKVAGVALDAEGMKIGGHVLLRMTIPAKGKDSISFFANGRVGISSSEIAGQLVCSGAFMRSATPSAEEDKEAGTLWADCIRVGRSVYLDKGFHSIGEVSLDAAEIGGRLDCSAAKFESRVKNRKIARVLSVRGATIARSVLLCHGFFSEGGRVELTRSRIGGHLHAHWARFSNPDHDVLDLSQAKITGMVRLGLPANDRPESPSRNLERQCYIGSVRMAGAHIGDNLECENGLFMLNEARTASDPAKKVLWAARAIVHGHVHLLADVQCPSCGIYGQMGFRGAVVHGNFHMRRMTVEVNSNGAHQGHPNQEPDPYPDEKPRSYVDERPNVAITLIRADIRGSAFMEECRFKGEMRMHAMRIGGLFSLVGTEVDAAAGPHPPYLAIAANGIRIEGELFMQRGFKALGEVRLFGAQVGGRILCHSARLENPKGRALSLDLAKSSADIWIRGSTITGGVALKGAEIGGSLVVEGSTVGSLDKTWPAIDLDQACLTGGLEIKGYRRNDKVPDPCLSRILGTLTLRGTRIAGGFKVSDSELRAPEHIDPAEYGHDHAVAGEGFSLGGRVDLSQNCKVFGALRLRRGRIDGDTKLNALNVDNRSPKGDSLSLRGTIIAGSLTANGLRTRGRLDLSNAEVNGRIIIKQALLRRSSGKEMALYAPHLNAKASVDISGSPTSEIGDDNPDELSIDGCVSLYSAKIGGGLTMSNLKFKRSFSSKQREARVLLDAQDLTVAGEFEWTAITYVNGNETPGSRFVLRRPDDSKYIIDLTEATILGLLTDVPSWKTNAVDGDIVSFLLRKIPKFGDRTSTQRDFVQLALGGFTYKWVTLTESQQSYAKALLPWLRAQEKRSFSLQPFEQLREALYRMGREFDAREVSFEKMHHLRVTNVGGGNLFSLGLSKLWRFLWSPLTLFMFFLGYITRPLRRLAFMVHAFIM